MEFRDDLKAKAQQLAKEQGVSLNSYINATLAATVAQSETLAMFGDRLTDVNQERLHAKVVKFMSRTRPGTEPALSEIEQAASRK